MADTSQEQAEKVKAVSPGAGPGPAQGPRIQVVHAPGAKGRDAEQGLSGRFLLETLKRRWRVVLPLGLVLSGVAAAAGYWLYEPRYEASAWFRIADRSPFVAFEDKQDERSRAFFQTQLELIRSPIVLGTVARQKEIASIPLVAVQPDPVLWLSKQVKVLTAGESELFRIAFTCNSSDHAAMIANAVADTYFRLRDQYEVENNRRIIELLEQERTSWSKEVGRLQQNLREIAKGANVELSNRPKFDEDSAAWRVLADLQSRLVTVQSERAIMEAQIKAIEEPEGTAAAENKGASDGHAAAGEGAEPGLEIRPDLQKLGESLAGKMARLKETETRSALGAKDPACVRLAEEIRQDKLALEQARRMVVQDAESGLAVKRRVDLVKMRNDLSGRRVMEEVLKEQYATELKRASRQTGDGLEVELKRAELSRAESIFERIAERILKLQTERGAPARVYLLQKAEAPVTPTDGGPIRWSLLCGLAGFFAPFGLALVWDRTHRKVGNTDSMTSQSEIPVIGEVAKLSTRRQRRALAKPENHRPSEEEKLYKESVDSLSTAVLLSQELHGKRILAVTSAVPAEGKTSLSVQLALSIARSTGQATLLIDGDMRAPDVHRMFGIRLEPGLVDVLGGKCSLADAIVTTWNPNLHLHLLPAGRLHVTPHGLLGDGAWRALLASVPQSYTHVIVDTPPVLAASESIMLSEAADATLLCAMRDVSLLDQVKRARERLLIAGIRPLAVLNGVPTREYSYRYGRYYSAEDPT